VLFVNKVCIIISLMLLGTLMELGISPIVTSGLIMQVSSYLIVVTVMTFPPPG